MFKDLCINYGGIKKLSHLSEVFGSSSIIFISLISISITPRDIFAEPHKKPLPNITLTDPSDKIIKLHDLKGQYVLLTLICTRCTKVHEFEKPMRQMKDLIDKYKQGPSWRKNGFPLKVLAITVEPTPETTKKLKDNALKLGLDFSYLLLASVSRNDFDQLLSELENHETKPGDGIAESPNAAWLTNPLMIPIHSYQESLWTKEKVLIDMYGSVSWWKWFFLISSILAIPGLFLLWRIRTSELEQDSHNNKTATQ